MSGFIFFCISICITNLYASVEEGRLDTNIKISSSNIFPNIPMNQSSLKTQDEDNNRDLKLAKRSMERKRVKFPKLKFSRDSFKKYLKTINELHKKAIINKKENFKSDPEKQFFSKDSKNKKFNGIFFKKIQNINLNQIIEDKNPKHLKDIIDINNIQEIKNISEYIKNS